MKGPDSYKKNGNSQYSYEIAKSKDIEKIIKDYTNEYELEQLINQKEYGIAIKVIKKINKIDFVSNENDEEYFELNNSLKELKIENICVEIILDSQNDYTEFMRFLINKNSSVKIQNENEFTSLMTALTKGDARVVQFLLSKGNDVNAKEVSG